MNDSGEGVNFLFELRKSGEIPEIIEYATDCIRSDGLVPTLILLLRTVQLSEESLSITIDAISKVARKDVTRQLAFEEAINDLVARQKGSSNIMLKLKASEALFSICAQNEHTESVVRQTEAFPELIKLLTQRDEPKIQRKAAKIIEDLCNRNVENQLAFAKHKIIKVLVNELKISKDDFVICGLCLAASAIVNGINKKNMTKFRKIGVIPLLITLLTINKRNMVLESISTFILELCRGNAKNAAEFFAKGGLHVLFVLMKNTHNYGAQRLDYLSDSDYTSTPSSPLSPCSTISSNFSSSLVIYNCLGITWFCILSKTSVRRGFMKGNIVELIQGLRASTYFNSSSSSAFAVISDKDQKIIDSCDKILRELDTVDYGDGLKNFKFADTCSTSGSSLSSYNSNPNNYNSMGSYSYSTYVNS